MAAGVGELFLERGIEVWGKDLLVIEESLPKGRWKGEGEKRKKKTIIKRKLMLEENGIFL